MKTRPFSFTQALQKALQLDFFSDLLSSEGPVAKLKRTPVVVPKRPVPPAPPLTPHKNTRKILLHNSVLEYELQRSKRRSIGFLIAPDGLRVTAPRWVTLAQIEQAITEKQGWILDKLEERHRLIQRRQQSAMRWEDGASLPYFGSSLCLRITPARRTTITYQDATRELHIGLQEGASEQQLKDKVKVWLRQEAHRVFSERLPLYAEKLGVSYHSMALSNAGTRWGSCTSQGKIRLNWRLIHFRLELIDYVIAHELSHLREMNHSPRFWATVESIFPDFKSARKTLRQHAAADLPVF